MANTRAAQPKDLLHSTLAGHSPAIADGRFHFFAQEFGAAIEGRKVTAQALKASLDSDRLADLLLPLADSARQKNRHCLSLIPVPYSLRLHRLK